MSLFTSGDNGTFDNTVDPTGNPPSDWNITKSADSIVRYTTDNPITGTGSMHCESRTIFNDDYALMTFDSTNPVISGQGYTCNIKDVSSLNFNNDFGIELRFYWGTKGGVNPIVISSIAGLIRLIPSSSDRLLAQFDTSLGRTGLISNNDVAPVNTWIHLVLTHEVGVGMRMYINGDKTEKISDFTPVNLNPPEKVQFYGRSDNNTKFYENNYIRGVRIFQGTSISDAQASDLYGANGKVIQSVPVALQANLTDEYLLNQEQGQQVRNSETDENDAELSVGDTNSYTLQQLQFNGGAWVDVSEIN